MKKILWIVGITVVVIFLAATVFYFVRKKQAANQYVHRASESVLAISIDDLLLDNMGQLLKSREKSNTPADSTAKPFWKNILASGIKIPARMYWFSLPKEPSTFYTIQQIDDKVKWDGFLKEYLSDSVHAVLTSNKPNVVSLNNHVTFVADDKYVILRVSVHKNREENDIKSLLDSKKDWLPLKDLPNIPAHQDDQHLSYWQTKGKLRLAANISDGICTLDGDYEWSERVNTPNRVREMDTTKRVLSLWSTLPLKETPLLSSFLKSFSNLSTDSLAHAYGNYVDLFVTQDSTIQLDTIITYGYDADFNSLEQKEVRQIYVPVIENVWFGTEELYGELPDKMLYQYKKERRGDTLLIGTKSLDVAKLIFREEASPLQLDIDFSKWPLQWTFGPFSELKKLKSRIHLTTQLASGNKIHIKGVVTY